MIIIRYLLDVFSGISRQEKLNKQTKSLLLPLDYRDRTDLERNNRFEGTRTPVDDHSKTVQLIKAL
jgi:hypothetical protein